MKAFLISVVLLLVISLGAGYALDGYFSNPAEQAYSSPTTRL
jgi:hypothetical protein